MALYGAAARGTGLLINTPQFEIIASATVGARLLELGLSASTGTGGVVVGLGVPQAIGVTPGGLVTVQAEDQNGPAGNTKIALSWATAPTIPKVFLEQDDLTNAAGTGVVWTFPLGIVIPINRTIVVWNVQTCAAFDIWIVVDE